MSPMVQWLIPARYSTRTVLQDFQSDGVVYIELRTTPRASPQAGISKESYVSTVVNILNEHNEDTQNTLKAFLILSIDRRNTAAEADQVVDLAIKYRSQGVVGIDLCGDPAKGDVRIFGNAFARAKAAGLKMTLHFAEAEASASDIELQTLLSWKPDRLGHVIHVKKEFQKIIEENNIGVELCLSCNVHAKMITGTYSDHHFGMWRYTQVPTALSVRCTHFDRCLSRLLTRRRLMMWVYSVAHFLRNTCSLLNTSIWIVLLSRLFVREL